MTDITTPPETGTVIDPPTSLSFADGVNAIENLLSDDLPEGDTKGSDGQKPVQKTDEAEASDDDDLVIDDDDASDDLPEETRETSEVNDDYEIEIDGEKVTLGDLKKGNLRQRDYTKKTEELARQRDEIATERTTIQKIREQTENELAQERERLYKVAARYFPQKPGREMLETDPIGYMQAMEEFNARVEEMQALEHEDRQRAAAQAEQTSAKAKEWEAEQRAYLYSKVPSLKDEAKRNAFISDLGEIGMKEYGLTAEEIPQITDGRYLRVLHDAIQYRKAVARQAANKKVLDTKPKMKQQQRMNVNTQQSRDQQGRFEIAKARRDINSVAKSIEDLL